MTAGKELKSANPDFYVVSAGREKPDKGKDSGIYPPDVMRLLEYRIVYNGDGSEKSRKIVQSVRNHEIVLENDCRFKEKIKFDEFSRQTYLMGAVPWDDTGRCRPWSSHDDSALFSLVQNEYGLTNRNDFFDAIKNVSMRHKFHPVRQLLESLEWDGKEHISQLLPDYLGAEVSPYTYEVLKLWMVAAVARVCRPGCKFDYCMILKGEQGLGKSTFLRLLALKDEWFNDSLDSLDSDKAVQSLTGSWVIELAELKSLARTSGGVESVKRFLSATQDKYRIPYERRADVFLRQNVFAGTTNKSDFLQDETGNRRFLIIQVGITEPKKDLFGPEAVDDIRQAWAQAVHIYQTENPVLVLPKYCQKEAEKLQADNLADDGKTGIIEEYLRGKERVCILQIWQEALQENGRPQKWQSSEIGAIIEKIPGWKRMKSPTKFGDYGSQRGFCYNPPAVVAWTDDEETPFDD